MGVNRIYINDTQYFNNIPEEVWSFYIGGYQPAQKWLKDRKGMTLTFDDIAHYQKIIKVLKETIEIIKSRKIVRENTKESLRKSKGSDYFRYSKQQCILLCK
jgi:hypothetical protein